MASIEVKNNHCKNDICNSIRSALTTKSEIQLPRIDRKERVFDPLDDAYQNFKREFTEAGGLLYEFEVERERMSDVSYVSQRLGEIYNQIKFAVDAGRWKRVLNVDLPAIMPTISILLILRFGHIMSVGYEKILLMQNDLNLTTSEVISTYVYKTGLGKMRMSYGTAIGLFNSVVNVIMLLTVNTITRKLTDGEQGLF